MAKRLSKALRGKRRWLGVLVDNRIANRKQFEKMLTDLDIGYSLKKPIRLMDFKNNKDYDKPERVEEFLDDSDLPKDVGAAIIEVQLNDYTDVRNLISEFDFFYKTGLLSYTASGKIKLVRERIFG